MSFAEVLRRTPGRLPRHWLPAAQQELLRNFRAPPTVNILCIPGIIPNPIWQAGWGRNAWSMEARSWVAVPLWILFEFLPGWPESGVE